MICLTDDELIEITRRRKYGAQRKALNAMGIDHRIRPDGSLMVNRAALDTPQRPQTPKKRVEPNWEAMK